MASPDKLIKELFSTIESAVAGVDSFMPRKERELYSKLIEAMKELKVKDGTLENSVANLKLIDRIVNDFKSFVDDVNYQEQVAKYAGAFSTVSRIHNQYFTAIEKKFKPKPLLEQIRRQSITDTVQALTEAGVSQVLSEGIKKMLTTSIRTGDNFPNLVEQLRGYMVGVEGKRGALQRYAKQITTDALNQFSAQYSATIVSDLGLEWYEYLGSNLTTTRPWCEHMTELRWVHRSEFHSLIHDHVGGVAIGGSEIPVYKKTGLPQGMIEGTNENNLISNRGGWECGHQFVAVTESMVPEHRKREVAAMQG